MEKAINEYRHFLKSNFVGVNKFFKLIFDSSIERYEKIRKLTTGQSEY